MYSKASAKMGHHGKRPQSSGSANSEGKLKHLDNLATPGNHKYQRTRTEYRYFLYNSSIESDFGGNT